MSTTWCCTSFQGLVENTGKRGLSAFAADDHPLVFVLQCRAADIGHQLTEATDFPVTLVGDVIVRHCPGCGVRLDRHYRTSAIEFLHPELRVGVTDV